MKLSEKNNLNACLNRKDKVLVVALYCVTFNVHTHTHTLRYGTECAVECEQNCEWKWNAWCFGYKRVNSGGLCLTDHTDSSPVECIYIDLEHFGYNILYFL